MSFSVTPSDPFWSILGLILSNLIEVGMQFDASFTVTVTRRGLSTP